MADDKKPSALAALFERIKVKDLTKELSRDEIEAMSDKLSQAMSAKDEDEQNNKDPAKMSESEFAAYSRRVMEKGVA